MKICTVVLTYDEPLYNHFDCIKKQYLQKHNEEFIFVYNGTDNSKHNLKNNTYNYYSDINHSSGIPVMFEKFIDVTNNVLLDKYDFVIRVNSSTFINIEEIKLQLKNKTDNVYMGFFNPTWNFISGACTIFSNDVLKKIVENAHNVNKYQEDDIAIGHLMQQLNIPKTFLDRASLDSYNTIPPVEVIKQALTMPQIRIRNNFNRELIDIGIWNTIADLI